MADNYTQFSVMLPMPGSYVQAFFSAWEAEKDDNDDSDTWWEVYTGFKYEIRPTEGVWVHDVDGNGNVEAAAGFIQKYLEYLNTGQAVFMSWACTCSKPRINEFDGGGVVVTATKMYWVNAYAAIQQAIDAGVDCGSIIGG